MAPHCTESCLLLCSSFCQPDTPPTPSPPPHDHPMALFCRWLRSHRIEKLYPTQTALKTVHMMYNIHVHSNLYYYLLYTSKLLLSTVAHTLSKWPFSINTLLTKRMLSTHSFPNDSHPHTLFMRNVIYTHTLFTMTAIHTLFQNECNTPQQFKNDC